MKDTNKKCSICSRDLETKGDICTICYKEMEKYHLKYGENEFFNNITDEDLETISGDLITFEKKEDRASVPYISVRYIYNYIKFQWMKLWDISLMGLGVFILVISSAIITRNYIKLAMCLIIYFAFIASKHILMKKYYEKLEFKIYPYMIVKNTFSGKLKRILFDDLEDIKEFKGSFLVYSKNGTKSTRYIKIPYIHNKNETAVMMVGITGLDEKVKENGEPINFKESVKDMFSDIKEMFNNKQK